MSRHRNTGWKADCDKRKEQLVAYMKLNPNVPIGALARRFGTCKKTASKLKRAMFGPSTGSTPKRQGNEDQATVREIRTVKPDLTVAERPKRERLFWTQGAKLFCVNREPAEVGT